LIPVLEDPTAVAPSRELEGREMVSFLRDAVKALPERQRIVIVGYFLEDRTSQELAELLGVTESHISQMRTEALESMRRGIEAQYENEEEAPNPRGRLAKRRAGYANAIGEARDWKRRLDDEPELLPV
ncbi:MAG: sigma-70 family RNA polymerase sigma factor, partial [Planctomycetales bacterium]|nr:sigma-70 family RNA polymerase sigma factor [Planctomycetales bacterium]